ncbi:N-acetylmuramoyl-L-alanine amidase [Paraflavisolibacter sp. H34]|uniref:N-acetylmuramoyl-L-alanine amidase n=1 Tax=Huijunlia imazamoxiresistens TaxID=3127457 RepID=UPI003017FDDC
MSKSIFRIFSFDEFNRYLRQTAFRRRITFVQNHHTWRPDYTHFNHKAPQYMTLLENMRHAHIHTRGWQDIGQNITIFPDGMVGLCRALDLTPAGIYGANTGAICIESLGNFDEGGDQMTPEQKDAIVKTNAALCIKFGLQPVPHQVVYHHWYDTKGRRFSPVDIDNGRVLRHNLQKTCPGTNFFRGAGAPRGNTIQSATTYFYPLITQAMQALQRSPVSPVQPQRKRVTADKLNVRAGSGANFRVVRQLFQGTEVQVFDTASNWSRISLNAEEWVSTKFIA